VSIEDEDYKVLVSQITAVEAFDTNGTAVNMIDASALQSLEKIVDRLGRCLM